MFHRIRKSSASFIQGNIAYYPFFNKSHRRFVANEAYAAIYEIKKPVIDFDTFGGYVDAKNSLSDIVYYLQNPKLFLTHRITAPKSVLLSGPPGVGKRLMAEAVAGHSGVPMISVSALALFDNWVSSAEEKLRDIFDLAAKNTPCVLLLDEIDSIAGIRCPLPNSTNQRKDHAIVNQLFSLLSNTPAGVVVIATTNHVDNPNTAVNYFGRFDKQVRMLLPNQSERLEIIKSLVEHKPLDKTINLNHLASISVNFSGATLARWVNQANMLAIRASSDELTLIHFDVARSMIRYGCLGRSLPGTQKLKMAQHEIGHALVAYLLGVPLYKISILQIGDSLGRTEYIINEHDSMTQQVYRNTICTSLAGRAAERIYGRQQLGAASDIFVARQQAIELIAHEGMGTTLTGLDTYQDVENILQQEMARAEHLLKKNPSLFKSLVNALMHEEELFAADFAKVIKGDYSPSTELKSDRYRFNNAPPKKKNTHTDELLHKFQSLFAPVLFVELNEQTAWYDIKFTSKPSLFVFDGLLQMIDEHHIEHHYNHVQNMLSIKAACQDELIQIITDFKKQLLLSSFDAIKKP